MGFGECCGRSRGKVASAVYCAVMSGQSSVAKPGRKLCPHVIIEGTRLTWKTELAFALQEHPRITGPRRYRYHCPVISAEWCAFTNTPWGRGMINFQPEETALALEANRAWMRVLELQPYYAWIIDRWHLSTQVHQAVVHGHVLDYGWLEGRLARLNFHVVLCTRADATFAAARERRLRVSGNPRQYDDLDVFVAEQRAFRRAAAACGLPVLEVDVGDDDVAGAAERVADWLTERGALWLRDGLVPHVSESAQEEPDELHGSSGSVRTSD
jgi:hypothetical protein